MSDAPPNSQDLLDDQPVVIAVPGPNEWIVGVRTGGRALHVYRVANCDWLVSEVGRGNEGRGRDLGGALSALAGNAAAPTWWSSIPTTLEGAQDSLE